METRWNTFVAWVADVWAGYWPVIVAAAVLLALAVMALVVWRRRRRRTPAARPAPGAIRRPVYVDPELLEDLRAHTDLEPRTGDHAPGRTSRTRLLNDTIDALDRADMLLDLDRDREDEVEIAAGRAVLLTGTLERLPATDAAALLELSTPLLERARHDAGDGDDHDGQVVTRPTVRTEVTDAGAPVVVKLRHATGDHLMVLPRSNLRIGDPTELVRPLTVLAVVERVLGRREKLDVDDYLRPHLSPQGRDALGTRDLSEVVGSLHELTDDGGHDLAFRGPGLVLTPAAVWR